MITDLIIPLLNEAENIPALFDALDPLQKQGAIRHIIVGDNGSTDGSPELVMQRGGIVVYENEQRGYGAACLKAIEWIKDNLEDTEQPDVVAFFDADLADDPEQLPILIGALTDHDIAIGCRVRLAEPGAMNLPQRFGNFAADIMMYLATGKKFHDLGPMRVIKWDTFQRLNMQDKTWGWTVELQTKAAIAKLKVAEIDVPYRKRRAGKSKISGSIIGSIKAAYKITVTIWYIRMTWKP